MNDVTRWTLVLALASLLAAPAGWTEEEQPQRDDAAESPAEASREQAREANEEAAREASEAIEASTRLDLDIRLIGPTSVKIAGQR